MLTQKQKWAIDAAIELCDYYLVNSESADELRGLLAAHNAGAQEPVAWLTPGNDLYLENPGYDDWTPLYTQPQPMPQTDAARDAEDAKRYRWLREPGNNCITFDRESFPTLHELDAALDAEIERSEREGK